MSSNGNRTISNVLEDIVADVQNIIRSEVRLAKVEVREEAVKAGKAAGILGSGAMVGLFALGFLLLAGLFALEIVVAAWLAALIVAGFAALMAGFLITIGRSRMKHVERPNKTLRTIKENLEWAKHPPTSHGI